MSEIPTSDWTWINAAADRFERAWHQGTRPRIEDHLAEVEELQRPALLEELFRVELELRRRAGEEPVPEDYTRRFPEHAEWIEVILSPGPGRSASSVPMNELPTIAPDPSGAQTGGNGEPAVGARVRYFGDYEIVRELARGGMGVVFQARQVSLNRPVALKMILAGQLADETDVKRFHTEAEAAANLDHPGIVPIFEVGQHEGQHYFSMGFVEGQSLAQRLADGPLPPREAAALMVEGRRGDRVCPPARRDPPRPQAGAISCSTPNGNPRVTDFGLAKKLQGDSGLTGSGQIMGTPSYMPPEQAGGKRGEVGPAADVYALGATLYCPGHRPAAVPGGHGDGHGAPGHRATSRCRRGGSIASIPRDLETICLKCLEKEPERRYASARDAGRGPAAVPGGRADPGAAGGAVGACGEMGAAAARYHHAAGIGRARDGAGVWGRTLAMARGGAGAASPINAANRRSWPRLRSGGHASRPSGKASGPRPRPSWPSNAGTTPR